MLTAVVGARCSGAARSCPARQIPRSLPYVHRLREPHQETSGSEADEPSLSGGEENCACNSATVLLCILHMLELTHAAVLVGCVAQWQNVGL